MQTKTDDTLQVLLKEYEMLVAENRLWLTSRHTNISIALAA